MRGSHSASGRVEGEVGRVGIKTEEKRKEMERGSFAQPSITFLGFKFIWLHFSLKYTEHKRGARGMERKGGRRREKTAWREVWRAVYREGNYLGVRG